MIFGNIREFKPKLHKNPEENPRDFLSLFQLYSALLRQNLKSRYSS